jgi:hypothetical protein
MNARAISAAVISAIVLFVLGYLVFGLLLHDWYTQQTAAASSLMNKPMPILWSLFLAQLLFTLLLALIFERYAAIRTAAGGAIAGLWIGFLIFMSFDLSLFAFYKFMSLQFAVIDGLLNTVMAAVGGGVVGLVLGFRRR